MTEVVDATASPGRVAPRVGPAFVEAVGLQKTYAVRRGEPVKAFEDLSFTIPKVSSSRASAPVDAAKARC